MGFNVRLTSFDLFPKLSDDLHIRRSSSGLLSIFTFCLIGVLLVGEYFDYRDVHWVSSVTVDTRGIEGHIAINIDLTFPGMKCGDFGLDVVDVTGELQLGAENSLQTTPVGAGCNIKGTVIAHKVDGEFHVAFGRLAKPAPGQQTRLTASQAHSTMHVHQFSLAEIGWFNASHTVNHISFFMADQTLSHISPTDLGIQFPLDGLGYMVSHDTARVTYFIKIVPTTYITSSGEQFELFQISHKQHIVPVVISRAFRQPGVFFKFEMSPYHVVNVETRKPFILFLSTCCALVSGVYVSVDFISRMLSSAVDKICKSKTKTPQKA
ncbi:Endoplasmic reticulum-Golgi intermediate compartment protein 1 [Pelomyxa schiedti]|nr:Endoplasmic reticulum-Golgi intermediate compartment protein 1 [Pelomyxa schiedti]